MNSKHRTPTILLHLFQNKKEQILCIILFTIEIYPLLKNQSKSQYYNTKSAITGLGIKELQP